MKFLLLAALTINCAFAVTMSKQSILESIRSQLKLRDVTLEQHVKLHKLARITQDEKPQEKDATTLALITDDNDTPQFLIGIIEGEDGRIKEVDEDQYLEHLDALRANEKIRKINIKRAKRKKKLKRYKEVPNYDIQFWPVGKLQSQLIMKSAKIGKYKIFKAKSYDQIQGNTDSAEMIMTYLFNGMTGKERSVKVQVRLTKDGWGLYGGDIENGNEEQIQNMHFIVKTVFGMAVGIKRISINKEATILRKILQHGRDLPDEEDNFTEEEIPYLGSDVPELNLN